MRPATRLIALLTVVVLMVGCNGSADESTAGVAVSTTTTSTTAASTTTAPTTTTVPATTTTTATTASAVDEAVQVADAAAAIQRVLVSGTAKLDSAAEYDDVATYRPSGVDDTQVGRVRYRDDVTLDVYYPPAYHFNTPLPTVVLINAFSATADTVLVQPDGEVLVLPSVDFQNATSFVTSANLAAASDLVAVVYGTSDDPRQDLTDTMEWLATNADDLAVDPERICVWMWSAHTLTGLRAVMDDSGSWQRDLACAAVYYGWMPTDQIRADLPLHIVKALDDEPFFIESIDTFMATANEAGAPVVYREVEGPHAFDREPAYADITATVIEDTLSFLRTQRLPG